jgi:threonine dehydrogenase-like Zn-dependent dehydrogenase
MRAVAVFPGKKQVQLIDTEAPRALGEGEVRLRMLEVGVCGTDREIASFQYGTPPEGSEFLVIGHESLAEVIEIGKGVTRVKPKDLVVTMVRRPCPHADCPACRAGRQDFCLTGDFTERGIKGRHGFMTEQIVDHERFMHVVPQALREVGVLTEPLTIAQKGLNELRAINTRLPWSSAGGTRKPKAVVLGAGPVGLLGVMSLIEEGFETYVYSRSKKPNPKAALAESIGAPYISSEECPVESLPERVGNIDVVYEATGASRVSFDVMRVLGTNGVFIFTGVPGRKAPTPVDTDLLMRNLVLKNQVVFGTVNAGFDAYQNSIDALTKFDRRWPEQLRKIITGRHAIDAYAGLLQGAESGIKDVIRIAA